MVKVGALLLVALAAGLLAAAPAVEARDLLQSATCRSTVPKCTPGQCSSLQGASGRLVCNRCLNNFAPVTRVINGAKYIVQCVCPKGMFAQGDNCVTCPKGAFCTGGDFIDSPTASLGKAVNCSSDGRITTRASGSQSSSSCVAPAGFVISNFNQLGGAATASPCGRSTYAPANNRLQACVKCQAGLQEDLADGLGTTAKPRADVNTVCKVPPGKWYSQNVVKTCAAGLYRGPNYVAFKDQAAATCTSCPVGITTAAAGSTARANCSKLLPGYGVDLATQAIIPGQIGTLPSAAQTVDVSNDTVSGASVCGIGYYSDLRYNLCVPCPYGTVTRANQSTSISDCQIPPGYVVTSGNMVECGGGTFRAGWLSWNSSATCTSCGANINSAPVDTDENPLASDDFLTRASPASCYIEAGWEVTYNRAANTWSARACPANTYGVADRLYGLYTGLVQVPCKACPRGMVTLPASQTAWNDSDACTNPAGYGYSSEGATPCAPGFWAAEASKLPCAQCAAGRITVDNSAQQTSVTACTVNKGYGITATDLADANGNNTLQAAIAAAPCDIGYYQPIDTSLTSQCIQCSDGTSTSSPGSDTCNVCSAGYGRPNGDLNQACTKCSAGSYARNGDVQCSTCVTTDFYNVQGAKIYTSNGVTTFEGATGSEFCVPAASHLAQDAGQMIDVSGLNATPKSTPAATSASDCISKCGGSQCCIAAWTASTSNCSVTAFTPVTTSTVATSSLHQIHYKLPPSDRVGASSKLGAKVMSSGIYAQCQLGSGDDSSTVGTTLKVVGSGAAIKLSPYGNGADSYTTATIKECKDACDGSALCWGFGYDGTKCSFRGGEDALGIDTFFVLPSQASLVNYSW